MDEWCQTCEQVMSRMSESLCIWMSHAIQINESCFRHESRHTHEWVMLHIWLCISQTNESRHTYEWVMSQMHASYQTCQWVVSRILRSHSTLKELWMRGFPNKLNLFRFERGFKWSHINESCHTYQSVMSHQESCQIWMCHITYIFESCHIDESCHIWMSHVTHMNASCHINESCYT